MIGKMFIKRKYVRQVKLNVCTVQQPGEVEYLIMNITKEVSKKLQERLEASSFLGY